MEFMKLFVAFDVALKIISIVVAFDMGLTYYNKKCVLCLNIASFICVTCCSIGLALVAYTLGLTAHAMLLMCNILVVVVIQLIFVIAKMLEGGDAA